MKDYKALIRRFLPLVVFAGAALVFVCIYFLPYLTGARFYCHDNYVSARLIRIPFDYFLSGQLPLWTPEMNSGEPAWPLAELMPFFDPVSFAVWPLALVSGHVSLYAQQVTCVIWLFIFSVGGMLCALRLWKNRAAALAVFLLLFGGPLAPALSAQPHLIEAFRYLPLVLWAFMLMWESPTFSRMFLLAVFFALSSAGYQTPYGLVVFAVFGITYIIFSPEKIDSRRVAGLLFACAVFTIFNMPVLVAGAEMLRLVPVGRFFVPDGYVLEKGDFFHGLFDPLCSSQTWHGGTCMGGPPVIFALAALAFALVLTALAVRAKLAKKDAQLPPPAVFAWLACAVFSAVFTAGLFGLDNYFTKGGGTFLSVRNWGFCLTPFLLSVVVLAAWGVKNSAERLFMFCGAGAAAICFFALLGFGFSRAFFWTLLLAAFFAAVVFTARRFGTAWAARVFCALVFFNLLFLSGWLRDHEKFIMPDDLRAEKLLRGADLFPPVLRPLPRTPTGGTYSFMDPLARHVFSAYANPVDGSAYTLNHLFRTPRLHALLASRAGNEKIYAALGIRLPVFHSVFRAREAKNLDDALRLMSSPETAGETGWSAIIEGPVPQRLDAALPSDEPVAPQGAEIHVSSFSSTHVALTVSMPHDGYLVWSDGYDSGWRAFSDGVKIPVYPADAAVKAVYLEAGLHEVEFSYFPSVYVFAFWLRVLCALALLTAGAVLLLQRRAP